MKRPWVAVVLGLCLAACGGDDDDDDDDGGKEPETGSTCPSSDRPTYDNFARNFMTTYCTPCHASTLEGAARQGAPVGYDLDTLDGIRDDFSADVLDRYAAAGPKKVNALMPPTTFMPQPPEAERRKLGQWLACGLR
ncbi:MAG TPA: hypothetical protein VFS43_32640 [Polyangiaceae bacterium]|nr:hypothetical protein [Polyangiaceae bacterium]